MSLEHVSLNELLQYSPFYQVGPDIDRIQVAHRLKLVEFWRPHIGDRILEIGCGQGSTTITLAHAVGPDGSVYAIDNASPDYGSPLTLAEAKAFIAGTQLGPRIEFVFETDVLSPAITFPEGSFDLVVLSLCSWYFRSINELREILCKTRSWAKRLAYAEWDPSPTIPAQIPHFLAVLLWAQYESFREESDSTLRALITPKEAKQAAIDAGWVNDREDNFLTLEMEDAQWEVASALKYIQSGSCHLDGTPPKFKTLLNSQVQLLENLVQQCGFGSLPTHAFTAE